MAVARILYCEGNFDGTVGGSYFSLLYLLEGLDRQRFDSLLVLRRDTPLMPQFKRAAGRVQVIARPRPFQIAVTRSPALRRIPLAGRLVGLVQSAVNFSLFCLDVTRLAWFLRHEGVQLVHLNNSVTSNHDWMLAAWLARIPCITHERGLNETYARMARFCAPRLAGIICISQAVHDRLLERGVSRDNLYMIHNGLDPERVVPTRSAAEMRQAYGLHDDQPVVGLLGNIRTWKGQEVLIRAMPAILKRLPTAACLLVGEASAADREYELYLRKLVAELGIESHVIFTGYCANVADALNVMHVAVHTSVLPEPFGRVLLEAMAMRKPLVGSRGGAVTEIIGEGVTGYTFEPGNADDLARRVLDLLEHPDTARSLGNAGYDRLVARFHVARNVEQTMALYSKILYPRSSEMRPRT